MQMRAVKGGFFFIFIFLLLWLGFVVFVFFVELWKCLLSLCTLGSGWKLVAFLNRFEVQMHLFRFCARVELQRKSALSNHFQPFNSWLFFIIEICCLLFSAMSVGVITCMLSFFLRIRSDSVELCLLTGATHWLECCSRLPAGRNVKSSSKHDFRL